MKTLAASCRALGVCAVTICAATVATGRVVAHGSVDQALASSAGCNVLNFTAAVTAPGGQRQEFVPSQPSLVAVDVCVLAEAGPTEVDVLVRTGDAVNPGGVIGGGSLVADLSAYEHVDFAAPIAVTPGQTYVIELETAGGLNVTWLGSPPDIDLYAAGQANAPGVASDFAFRTYAGAPPATATAGPTKTAAPTKTRTPTSTRTPLPTQTAAPTVTPPAAGTATATLAAPTIAPASTPPRQPAAAATATRVSGVLGGARRIGVIKPPDVGAGPSNAAASYHRVPWIALALLCEGFLAVAAGFARSARPR